MNTMTYRDYSARIEYDDEDGVFVGRVAGIDDGVHFHGETVPELRQAFHEAVDGYLDVCARAGKSPDKPYSGKLMIRMDPTVHARAAKAAELAGKSLNRWTEEKLKEAASADLHMPAQSSAPRAAS
jgi:predicted HicB family RNase H-like nuclease